MGGDVDSRVLTSTYMHLAQQSGLSGQPKPRSLPEKPNDSINFWVPNTWFGGAKPDTANIEILFDKTLKFRSREWVQEQLNAVIVK